MSVFSTGFPEGGLNNLALEERQLKEGSTISSVSLPH